MMSVGALKNQPYQMLVAGSTAPSTVPSYLNGYAAVGFWIESPILSPRSWLTQAITEFPISAWTGHSLFMSSFQSSSMSQSGLGCKGACAFDISQDYDLFTNTAFNLSDHYSNTWMGELQSLVFGIVKDAPGIVTIQNLYDNTTAYTSLMGKWTSKLMQLNTRNPLKDSAVHPITGNIWAIRGDVLYEISKSGVVLPLSSGKCMPSGVAVCSGCMWAQAGAQCRPCAQMNQSSWAWSIQCVGCSVGSRRLLHTQSAQVQFSVVGRVSLLAVGCAAGATWTEQPGGVWNVKISTTDPAQCLRDLTPVLAGYQVVVKPSIVIPIVSKPSSEQKDSSLSGGAIVGIVIGVLGVLLFCMVFIFFPGTVRPTHSIGPVGWSGSKMDGQETTLPRIVLRDLYSRVESTKEM
jgi:hypothetical protein